ncbi:MAG: hypothetical protein UH229_03255 [Lachnospiraceae bacterium]|nr:hypothetical protein [Lachnospiraceae bacterium]
MGAKAQKQMMISAPLMTIVERLRAMGPVLKYSFLSETPTPNGGAMFRFSHKVSLTSWGENVTVTAAPNGNETVVMIRSECALPTQLVDWGKNSHNCGEIAQYLAAGLTARDL